MADGPPKPPQRIAVGVRLTPAVIAWLDLEAERRQITRTAVATTAIEQVHRTMTKGQTP